MSSRRDLVPGLYFVWLGTWCALCLILPLKLSLTGRMASVDSEAFFDGRMSSMGITAATSTAVRSRGWTSLASYAYGSGFIPGQSLDTVFVEEVLLVVVGPGHATSPDSPRLRRLFFEAHTLALQDLRRRSERTESDVPVRLPAEERVVRLARLRIRYPGHEIDGASEPSNSLVDLLAQQLETGQLRYVPWSQCTNRNQEVVGVKKLERDLTGIIKEDTAGYLRRSTEPEGHLADTSTDLLLVQALQRRSFAFELAHICDFAVFNSLALKLLKELAKPPLHGYARITLEQVENADRHVFQRIASLTQSGLLRKANGDYPVEVAMTTVLLEPDFLFLLMQMPLSSSSKGSQSTADARPVTVRDRSRSRKRKTTEDNARRAAANIAKKGAKGPAKGAAKGGRNGSGKGAKSAGKNRVPGFDSATQTNRTAAGEPICYGFQDGSCTVCSPGERCPRGWHVCWFKACGQNHQGRSHQ